MAYRASYAREYYRERARRIKAECVLELGGKCARCGFNEILAALQLHHIDPRTKSPKLKARPGNKGASHSWASLPEAERNAELKKCCVLCANCHAGVESGAYTLHAR